MMHEEDIENQVRRMTSEEKRRASIIVIIIMLAIVCVIGIISYYNNTAVKTDIEEFQDNHYYLQDHRPQFSGLCYSVLFQNRINAERVLSFQYVDCSLIDPDRLLIPNPLVDMSAMDKYVDLATEATKPLSDELIYNSISNMKFHRERNGICVGITKYYIKTHVIVPCDKVHL